MIDKCTYPLICPVCEQPLQETGSAFSCAAGHSFDIAREGYVNLLLSRKKAPPIMGDTKQMLAARRRFLASGLYEPLSSAAGEMAAGSLVHSAGEHSTVVVDVGCGEGSYIDDLRQHLVPQTAGRQLCTFGVDISKDAARLAAKKYKSTRFVVADIKKHLPFAAGSVQLLLCVFAPRNAAEFARITTHSSHLLVVIPTPDHLASLRSRFSLLGIETEKKRQIITQFDGRFSLTASRTIAYQMQLNQNLLLDLVQMTPNYWHLTEEQQTRLHSAAEMTTTAAFELLLFSRSDPILGN